MLSLIHSFSKYFLRGSLAQENEPSAWVASAALVSQALHSHLLLRLGTNTEGVTSHSLLGKLLSLINIPQHTQ